MMKSFSACFVTVRLDTNMSSPYVEIADAEGYGTVVRKFETEEEARQCYIKTIACLTVFRAELVGGLGWNIDEPYTYGYGDEQGES